MRTSAVTDWIGTKGPSGEAYYVDTRGDRDNMVYDGLYQGDVAAYHRLDPLRLAAGTRLGHKPQGFAG